MARNKSKKGSKVNPIKPGEMEEIIADERGYIIKEATIKDGFCNYKYEITKGVGAGATHNVKGPGIALPDMLDAFGMFRVHLAVVDDAFKHNNIDIDDIDKFHSHELTSLYHVTGFKIWGNEENEAIVLIGNKYVSSGGRIELASPKIPLDNLSSYKYFNELRAAADKARFEVAEYHEGKYEAPDNEDHDDDGSYQMTIDQNIDEEDDNDDPGGENIHIPGVYDNHHAPLDDDEDFDK